MDAYDFSMELSGGTNPPGEISLAELSTLAGALQQLALRVGRFVADREGPGRTSDAVERATRMRLTGITKGSTTLAVAHGEHDVLAVEAPLEVEAASRFWEVIEGIPTGQRPAWVTPLIAQAATALISATDQVASSVRIQRRDQPLVTWASSAVDRAAWVAAGPVPPPEETVVSGRLEMVDLKSGRFRLRDDVGNAIELDHVAETPDPSRLVGDRVVATGPATRDASGRLHLGEGTRVSAAPVPAQWSSEHRVDWDAALTSAVQVTGGVDGVTGEDVEELLSELRR